MDKEMRDKVCAQLATLIKHPNLVNYRKAPDVLNYLAHTGYPLSRIWDNCVGNLKAVHQAHAKKPKKAKQAYRQALCLLITVKQQQPHQPLLSQEGEKGKKLVQVLELIDQALCDAPSVDSEDHYQLASLFCLRAMALAESGELKLALAAIKHALIHYPESLFLLHQKMLILYQMGDASSQANELLEGISHELKKRPTALDEESKWLGEHLFSLAADSVQKFVADFDHSPLYDSDDGNSEPHIGNQEEDSQHQPSKCEIEKEKDNDNDEYATPFEDTPKNFSFDYRCVLHPATCAKGRSLTTNEDIEEGELIFRERAYSLLLMDYGAPRCCHYCARDVLNRFWPCGSCSTAIYCGPQCAQLAWRLSHARECCFAPHILAMSKSTAHVFNMLSRLGVTNVMYAIEEQRTQGVYDLTDYRQDDEQRFTREVDKSPDSLRRGYRAQMTLFDHSDGYDVRFIDHALPNAIECAILACLSQGISKLGPNGISNGQLVELINHCLIGIRRVLTNVFRWSCRPEPSGEKVAVATCYQLLGAMFNHSCSPNLKWSITNGYIYMTTIRDVKAGEELFVSYGPYRKTDSFAYRQHHLMSDYFFRCNCVACLDESRFTLALQCSRCPGPVLPPILDTSDNIDAHCLMCGTSEAYAMEKFKQLEALFDKYLSNDGTEWWVKGSRRMPNIAHIMEDINEIRALTYSRSTLLVQAIYVAAQLLVTHKPNASAIQECLQLGSFVDSILPIDGTQLIALHSNPLADGEEEENANEEEEEASAVPMEEEYGEPSKYAPSAAYQSPRGQHASIDHLAFWATLYHDVIKSTSKKLLSSKPDHGQKVWAEMVRFYHRLDWLIHETIRRKEAKLRKQLGEELSDKCESADPRRAHLLRAEVNMLDTLSCFKRQEVQTIMRSLGDQFVQV